MRAVLFIAAMLTLTGCGKQQGETQEAPNTTPVVAEQAVQPVATTPTLADDDLARVCRATVAAINGHEPSIVKVDKIEDGIVYLSYARPSDGKVWKNRCRVEGDRVLWSTIDVDGPGSGFGRWRNDPADEVIGYRIEGSKVKITQTYSDGSASEDSFTVS